VSYHLVQGRVEEILDQFSIVRRKDKGRHGECRIKGVILEYHDAMLRGMR
jgi:hypothetical protein